ncbi:hypothetical protein LSAT2_011051 [Lamellibrachia satsuma]|nr:hypothetical protein LSAT2_011051 [Lamellibrachia satsuma]
MGRYVRSMRWSADTYGVTYVAGTGQQTHTTLRMQQALVSRHIRRYVRSRRWSADTYGISYVAGAGQQTHTALLLQCIFSPRVNRLVVMVSASCLCFSTLLPNSLLESPVQNEFKLWLQSLNCVIYLGDNSSRNKIREYEWCRPSNKRSKFNVLNNLQNYAKGQGGSLQRTTRP